MQRQKLIIVDAEETFSDALLRELETEFEVLCCPRGDQALKRIEAEKPDLVVMELMLEGLDGIGLLRAIHSLQDKPSILVASYMLSTYVLAMLEELDIQYVIKKPCSIPALVERIRELGDSIRSVPVLQIHCRRAATDILMELGLPNERQGFQHLLTGLPLLAVHRDQRLGKELYDTIALHSGGNSRSVEKAIRDTIRAGWESGNREVWQSYFPGCSRCPRNKEFLFRMTDLLADRRRA